MFVCTACTRRASTYILRRTSATETRLTAPSKAFATRALSLRDQEKNDFAGAASKRQPDDPARMAAKRHKTMEKLKRATKKELEWTTDPYHIAENVQRKLDDGQFDKALLLTQQASTNLQVVVSWNHLIENLFKEKRLSAAIKLYNDMKKRGQLPNAQTYTIIFRGCAASDHPKLAVNESLRIYNTMLASSRLKPNTIHMNAVLEVCARAQDIESLFVVLGSTSTSRSPNNLTYTIILNALRYQKSNHLRRDETDEDVKKAARRSIQTTIARSRLVWDEVMTRWKKGEIIMDEELMCAMGRILLAGGHRNTNDVLSLVAEVLGISRLRDGSPPVPPKKTNLKTEKSEEPGQPKESEVTDESEAETTRQDYRRPEQPRRREDRENSQKSEGAEDLGRSLQQSEAANTNSQVVTAPTMNTMSGNNTLSLVMRALAEDRRTKLAAKYWDYLTHTYGVVADRNNYRDYIDCLSTGAASGKAARVLSSMPAQIAEGNLMRRGLLMCKFDAFNESAFDNATVIFDAMINKLPIPDALCMGLYLEVSASLDRNFEKQYSNRDQRNRAYGDQIITAIERVWEPLRRATNELSFSETTVLSASPEESHKRTNTSRQQLVDVAHKMKNVCDRFLSQNLYLRGDQKHQLIVNRKTIIRKFIDRWSRKNQQYGQGPMRPSQRPTSESK